MTIIYIVLPIVVLGLWFWLVARIGKSSIIGAILTFFLGLPALYFLFKHWGDEELDIRVPFFVSLIPLALAIVAAVALPSYQDYVIASRGAKQQTAANVKSDPELERWCRQQNNAVYSPDHGTCVDGDLSQQQDETVASANVFDLLQDHFAAGGIMAEVIDVDENTPGAARLRQLPQMKSVTQFIFEGSGMMPTMALIGECHAADDCRTLAQRMDRPDAPFAVASNGNLIFMGMLAMGDAAKVTQAKRAFIGFKTP
jgi:hypothetical protein